MELRTLQNFLVVAREENITRAAELLHLTQPTLSRQLKDLEAEFGKTLLIRGKRRVTLTEEGILLRKRAGELIELAEKTDAEMRSNSEAVAGNIRIGGGETAGMRKLVELCGDLRTRYPQVRYSFFSGDGQDVVEQLDRGLLDFALFVGNVDISRFDSIRLPYTDTWGLLLPRDHPLTAQKTIRPQDLWEEPLILSRQACRQGILFDWLGRSFEQINMAGSYNLIYNGSLLVERGIGVAFCLENLVNTTGESRLTFRLLEPRLTENVYIAWKKYQIFSRPALKFLELLTEHLGKGQE